MRRGGVVLDLLGLVGGSCPAGDGFPWADEIRLDLVGDGGEDGAEGFEGGFRHVLGLADIGGGVVVFGGGGVDDRGISRAPPEGRGGEGGDDQRKEEAEDELFLGEEHCFWKL